MRHRISVPENSEPVNGSPNEINLIQLQPNTIMEEHPNPASEAGGAPEKLSHFKLSLILGALTAFGPLSIDMYLPAFPHIARDLAVPVGAVGFTLAAYLLGTSIGQLIYGPLADRHGRRKPLLAGCVIFGLGSLGCACSTSVAMLTGFRVVQALGGAAGMVIARAVVRDLFHEREAARMFAQLMLVMGICPVLAPTLGGQVLLLGNWRVIFYILIGFSVFCLFMSARFLPETLPINRRVQGGAAQAVRAFGAILRDRRFLLHSLAAGFGSGTLFAYISGSPFVFIQLHHVSEQRFGILFGLNAVGFISGAQLNRWLLHRHPQRLILLRAAAAGMVAGIALLVCGATGLGGLPLLWMLLFAALSSLGICGPNVAALALGPFGRNAGSASALLGTAQFFVGSLAGAAVGLFHNGTAIPMTATVAVCCVGSYLALKFHPSPPPLPG